MTSTRNRPNPYGDVAKRTTGHHPKLGWMIGGATAAVVAVIALLVLLWPSGGDEGSSIGDVVQENATVTISGEDLPVLAESGLAAPGTDDAVGLQVPELVGQDFSGDEVVIGPNDGTPKMVVFLAHWCPHCQAEVPLLQDWVDEGGVPEGMDVYAVATGQDRSQPNYPPSSWLDGEGWSSPVLLDDEAQSAAKSYGLAGYPYFVMIDADGNVWQRASGEVPAEVIDRLANELVAGESSTGGEVDPGSDTEVDLGNETS